MSRIERLLSIFLALLAWIPFVGCDAKLESFPPNTLYSFTLARSRSVPMEAALRDAAQVTEQLFGTPDQPSWPTQWLDAPLAGVVDAENLTRAAGSVASLADGTHVGLYREHCVDCHGISGGGNGPTALVQNPYPRDFRPGTFKWKSTIRAAKPTRQDLVNTIVNGLAGTAMPAHPRLSIDDLNAIVDYTIYLSVRGEVERALLAVAVDDLGYEEDALEDELRVALPENSTDTLSEGAEVTLDILLGVVEEWTEADLAVAQVTPPLQSGVAEAIERGRQLYHGPIANCVGCHGKEGDGELVTLDYDDWTKEYSSRIGLTPSDRQAMRPLRDFGALRPVEIHPRKLRNGVFRGGSDGETLYRRITQGIAGTPMPSLEVTESESAQGLTKDQVWDLVRYLQSFANHAEPLQL